MTAYWYCDRNWKSCEVFYFRYENDRVIYLDVERNKPTMLNFCRIEEKIVSIVEWDLSLNVRSSSIQFDSKYYILY